MKKKRNCLKFDVFILVFVMTTLFSFNALGATWFVSTNGSDETGDGSESNPFATIQYGINNAGNGDIVQVAAGTYYENVNVDRQIELKGVDIPVVDAENRGVSAILVSADGCTIKGFKVIGSNGSGGWDEKDAGIKVQSSNNTIENNIASGNERGIVLYHSSNNILRGNEALNNTFGGGIYLYYSSNNTLRDNIMYNNAYGNFGVWSWTELSHFRQDIDTSNTVDGKPIYYIVDESDLVIDSSSNAGCVVVVNSTNITVQDLTLANNKNGVLFVYTQDSRIENVTLINNGASGIWLQYSSNNTLIGNNITNSYNGICLWDSGNSMLRTNTISNCSCNFGYWSGSALSHFIQDIDTSNTVDGKPVYYLVDEQDMVIDASSDAGYVGVVNSNNIIVKDLNLKKNAQGILFAWTENSRIENINASDNADGIWLQNSNNNTLINNIVSNNFKDFSIYLQESNSTTIINNTITGNKGSGILSYYSSSTVMNNIIVNNAGYGIVCSPYLSITNSYNDIWNNDKGNYIGGCFEGTGDISAEPLFMNADNGDYRLYIGSPCIDAGNPNPEYNDVDGNRNDMGAYGGPEGISYPYQDGPPVVENVVAEPLFVLSGSDVTITAYVWDAVSHVASVQAEIEAPDETIIETIDLYDDGLHNDNDDGDGIYGNSWATPSGEYFYVVDIIATDDQMHTSIYNNAGMFTTRPSQIEIRNIVVDDDQYGYSYGNGDGILNPGEFIEFRFDLKNIGSETLNGIYGIPDPNYDQYFHPDSTYYMNERLYVWNSIPPDETFTDVIFNCFIASNTPENHIITVPIIFYDENDVPIGKDMLQIPVTGTDTVPPRLTSASADSPYTLVGNTVTITLFVYEASSISNATADIESPDETILTSIPLVDDGTNGDESAGDHVFTGQWNVSIEANFVVDFSATDAYNNIGVANNLTNFTSIPPPIATANILLVDDDQNNNPNWGNPKPYNEYYQEALDALGHSYDVWNTYYYGSPDYALLSNYLTGLVLWETGNDYISTLTTEDQKALSAYLDAGGNLFISGQLISYDLDWDGSGKDKIFYNDYLHAKMGGWLELFTLNGVSGDPITDGININISEGDGANNQGFASEISVLNSAIPIFIYPEPSLGTGALRIDTGTYKLVYFAFGFEAINSSTDRNKVMCRTIRWLGIPMPDDFDGDGDVDGSDLAVFAADPTAVTLEQFAPNFGRTDCP